MLKARPGKPVRNGLTVEIDVLPSRKTAGLVTLRQAARTRLIRQLTRFNLLEDCTALESALERNPAPVFPFRLRDPRTSFGLVNKT
jgi:hypothetical protein